MSSPRTGLTPSRRGPGRNGRRSSFPNVRELRCPPLRSRVLPASFTCQVRGHTSLGSRWDVLGVSGEGEGRARRAPSKYPAVLTDSQVFPVCLTARDFRPQQPEPRCQPLPSQPAPAAPASGLPPPPPPGPRHQHARGHLLRLGNSGAPGTSCRSLQNAVSCCC